ncbi:hypothetical protein B0H14DRAFT_2987805 [Mycena olivaceomarginata]|nr:hypothetical protein B0H14DRAFT_2987805 [Mycena olivaceomarginata]
MLNLFAATGVSVYINLFLLSVYTLARRRNGSGKKFLLAASCVIAVQLLHAQVIDHPRLVKTLQTAQLSLGVINKWVYPGLSVFALAALRISNSGTSLTAVVGIWASQTRGVAKAQIVYSLWMATNLVLTALTGNWSDTVDPDNATSYDRVDSTLRVRCNRAIGLILESGAIYCVGITVLLFSVSVKDVEVFAIGLGLTSQLLVKHNPTFTLVYVGLADTAGKSHPESDRKTHCLGRGSAYGKPTSVLDIKPQGIEEGDHV